MRKFLFFGSLAIIIECVVFYAVVQEILRTGNSFDDLMGFTIIDEPVKVGTYFTMQLVLLVTILPVVLMSMFVVKDKVVIAGLSILFVGFFSVNSIVGMLDLMPMIIAGMASSIGIFYGSFTMLIASIKIRAINSKALWSSLAFFIAVFLYICGSKWN